MSGRKNEPNGLEEEILHLEEYGEQGWSTVTVRITKWVYYVPRVKLTIVQGFITRQKTSIKPSVLMEKMLNAHTIQNT